MYDDNYVEITSYKLFKKHIIKPLCAFLKEVNKYLLEDDWFLGRFEVRLYSVQMGNENYNGYAIVRFIDNFNPLNNYFATSEVTQSGWYKSEINKQLNSWIIWCGSGHPGDSPSSIHIGNNHCFYEKSVTRHYDNLFGKYEKWTDIPKKSYEIVHKLFSSWNKIYFDGSNIPKTIINSYVLSGVTHNIEYVVCPEPRLDYLSHITHCCDVYSHFDYSYLKGWKAYDYDDSAYACFADENNVVQGIFRKLRGEYYITIFEEYNGKRYKYAEKTYKIKDKDKFFDMFDPDKSFRAYCILNGMTKFEN